MIDFLIKFFQIIEILILIKKNLRFYNSSIHSRNTFHNDSSNVYHDHAYARHYSKNGFNAYNHARNARNTFDQNRRDNTFRNANPLSSSTYKHVHTRPITKSIGVPKELN